MTTGWWHTRTMRRFPSLVMVLATVAGGLAAVTLAASPAGATVPAGFTDELVIPVGAPTALAFIPDGRMLVTTQGGIVRVVENGALVAAPAVDLASKICANSERGLLGVAVDPAFASNGFVFLYYSFNKVGDCGTGTVNRVARFVICGATWRCANSRSRRFRRTRRLRRRPAASRSSTIRSIRRRARSESRPPSRTRIAGSGRASS